MMLGISRTYLSFCSHKETGTCPDKMWLYLISMVTIILASCTDFKQCEEQQSDGERRERLPVRSRQSAAASRGVKVLVLRARSSSQQRQSFCLVIYLCPTVSSTAFQLQQERCCYSPTTSH